MPISIYPSQDTILVPVKLYKSFMDTLIKTYTKQKLESEVKIDAAKTDSVIESLQKLKNNADKNLKDDGADIKFNIDWNKSFSKDKESGEKLFEFLEKNELKDLEARSKTEYEKRKTYIDALLKASQAALQETETVLQAYSALNTAVDNANKAIASQPAATAPAAAPATTSTAQPLSESVKKELVLNKKLYEVGLIDRSEFLASLLNAKTILKEQTTVQPAAASAPQPAVATPATAPANTPPATAAAPTAASPTAAAAQPAATETADARSQLGVLIANVGSPNVNTVFKDYAKNVTAIKQTAEKLGQMTLNENKRRLLKSFIKKRILEEGIKQAKDNKKEYLNEILGLLLGGLLVMLGAWIGKKFAQYFKSGPATSDQPSQDQKKPEGEQSFDPQSLFGDTYTDPSTGQTFDQKGSPVNPKVYLESFNLFKTSFDNAFQKYEENLNNILQTIPKCGYDQANLTAVQNAANAIPKTLEKGKAMIKPIQDYINS